MLTSRRWFAGAALVAVLAGLLLIPAASAARGGNDKALDATLAYLKAHRAGWGLTGGDLNGLKVTDQYTDAHNGVTHVYLRQTHRGIEVSGANVNGNVARDGSVLSVGQALIGNLAAKANGNVPGTTADEAARSAGKHFGLKAAETAAADDGAKLVYQPVESGAVRLAWELSADQAAGDHDWVVTVDAATGAVLAQYDAVDHDTASAIAAGIARPAAARSVLATTAPTVDDGSSYNVFAQPLESPSDGARTIVANPANTLASPFGWHDTDGAAGPESTLTTGNNVDAYADRTDDNLPDPGSRPDGGAGLDFDFPLDLGGPPVNSQAAYVTNLFYWNNIVHDVAYQYGFTEAAGNFQLNNYGRGGLGGDYVRAEAQDGNGRNNANFNTPVDGQRPRMQMFEWRSAAGNPIVVTAPAAAAGTYFGPMAGFGSSLVDTGPISGQIVYVNDGVAAPAPPGGLPGTVNDGCEPFTVGPGQIPMVDRGLCNFTVKVKNAQNAGAPFAIVVNNNPQPPSAMAGADSTITIPSVMISLSDGATFKANVPLTATISDGTGGVPHRDSDIDDGVIAHEYTHGISNRLTGGPATVACLNNLEQMGEGWSDFMALVLTTAPSDTATTARGIGTYVSFQPSTGAGIRPTPYSTDTVVNPSTYDSLKDLANITTPHGIGYVWATMLWEVYWNLVAKHGYNSDIYQAWHTGGNNLALQLVMDGLKLQPCSPGFVTGRNAILQADLVLTGGANQCEIWNGFAKRGLGVSASQGSSNNRTDGTQAFDRPTACTMTGFFGGVKNDPVLNKQNAGATAAVTFSLGGDKGLDIFDDRYPKSQPIDCDTGQPAEESEETSVTGAGLTYDAATDRYTFPWKTSRSAAGCQMLILQFEDQSRQVAYFQFR